MNYVRALLLLYLLIGLPELLALEKPKEELPAASITTKLGTAVDLSLEFANDSGVTVTLASLMAEGKPTLILPVYYQCPRLCGLVLEGAVKLLNAIPLQINKDFQVVTVSFNSKETPQLAAKRASHYRARYKDPKQAERGWHFLVGNESSIVPLMSQLGFGYKPDGAEFAHSAAIMILTPTGKISQYFSGIEFSPFDLRLALVEAGQGGIGSPIDHVFLFCFRFDERMGKYTWAVFNLMRAGALLTLGLLVVLVVGLIVKERRAKQK